MFKKIIIANRGEIACRIIKTAKKMDIKTVSVFSDADRNAEHVSISDESHYIGKSDVNESLKIFQFAVDDLASWYTESPYLDSGWLIMDLTSGSDKAITELIQEIRKGQELFHLDDNNKIISSFSLNGSAASVKELIKCIEEQGF